MNVANTLAAVAALASTTDSIPAADQTNRYNVGRRYTVASKDVASKDAIDNRRRTGIRNKFVRRIFRARAIASTKFANGGSIARDLADLRRLRLAVESTTKSSHARRRLLAAELADRKARS